MTDAGRPGEQAAVEAALAWEQSRLPGSSRSIELAVAAAYPVIAAAMREQIAAEIEDRRESLVYDYASSGDAYMRGGADGLEAAARIARGTPDGQG